MRDSRRTRLVLVLLLLVSLTFVVLSLRSDDDAGPFATVRDAASSVFGPIESAAAAVVNPVRDFLGGLTSFRDKDSRIAELETEVDRLRTEANRQAYADVIAKQLEELNGTAGLGRYTIVPAQVIAYGSTQNLDWTVTIDAGSVDGIRPDMSVMTGDGLVGVTVSVAERTSVVRLLIDEGITVSARMEGSQTLGFASGTGTATGVDFELLGNDQTPIEAGARLVTNGLSEIYAPGIPIGVVEQAGGGTSGRAAQVRPFVDMTSLDVVGVVILRPRTDPRDGVLPPAPAPSGQPSTPSAPPQGQPSGSASNPTTSRSPQP